VVIEQLMFLSLYCLIEGPVHLMPVFFIPSLLALYSVIGALKTLIAILQAIVRIANRSEKFVADFENMRGVRMFAEALLGSSVVLLPLKSGFPQHPLLLCVICTAAGVLSITNDRLGRRLAA
jgi:hypothetical protein